jgi:hypothetical protein
VFINLVSITLLSGLPSIAWGLMLLGIRAMLRQPAVSPDAAAYCSTIES